MKQVINVTAPFIPSIDKYTKYISKAFSNSYLTNNGPLLTELTQRLKEKLGVKHLLLVSNGTIALQIAYKVKELANQNVLTTPYTFAATSTSLQWEKANIKFSNIDTSSWNISSAGVIEKLTKAADEKIKALVPVNLFGLPCELDEIDAIARQYNIPVIYDSAHALFSSYKGQSIFNYGDIHCVSLHATKLFHTGEGGLMTFKNEADYNTAKQLINFGITDNQDISNAGINGKMSELHAAMGLAVFDELDDIIEERQNLIAQYKHELNGVVAFQNAGYENYSQPIYMPVIFNSDKALQQAENELFSQGINPRRYFMPQHFKFINNINHLEEVKQTINIAQKILCLPLMNGLNASQVSTICNLIKKAL